MGHVLPYARPRRGKLVDFTFLNKPGDRATWILDMVGNGLFELEVNLYDKHGEDLERRAYALLVNRDFLVALHQGISLVLNEHAKNPI